MAITRPSLSEKLDKLLSLVETRSYHLSELAHIHLVLGWKRKRLAINEIVFDERHDDLSSPRQRRKTMQSIDHVTRYTIDHLEHQQSMLEESLRVCNYLITSSGPSIHWVLRKQGLEEILKPVNICMDEIILDQLLAPRSLAHQIRGAEQSLSLDESNDHLSYTDDSEHDEDDKGASQLTLGATESAYEEAALLRRHSESSITWTDDVLIGPFDHRRTASMSNIFI